MRKLSHRIICAALALCMLFTLGGVSAFADEAEEYPQFDTYTILGDSNAAGYGLTEYEQLAAARGSVLADGQWIDTAYGAAVSKAVGAKTTNWMAHSAWRTTDFLRAVGYEGFSFNVEPQNPYKQYIDERSWVRNGQLFITAFGMTWFNENTLRNELHDSIAESDLVSIQFGSNDIFTYMLMALIEKWGDIFSDIGDAQSLSDAVQILRDIVVNCPEGEKAELLSDVVNGCEAGLKMFKENYPKVIDYIRSVNPDAKIAVLGVLNPAEDLFNYSKNIDFDIFTITDYTCGKANIFLSDLCKANDNCIYVCITDCDGYGLPAMNWDKLINGSGLEPIFAAIKIVHPSEIGHAQIADRMLKALSANMKTPVVTASTNSTLNRTKLNWSKVAGAESYRVYRSIKENGTYLLVNATCGTSFTDLATLPGITYYYKVVAVMNTLGTVRSSAGTASATAQSVFKGLGK